MSSQSNIDLSIIIPAYKEAEIIGKNLETLADFLNSGAFEAVEVIVIVPDSPDDTAAAARAKADLFKQFRVIDVGERVGKGRDVRIGMFEARGKYRLFMDADLATPLAHIEEAYDLMKKGAKVAIAVRDLLKIHKGFVRKLVTKTANIVTQVLLLPGIKDTQCGFKIFEATAAEEIFARQTLLKWSFDVELLKIARLLNYRIDFIEAPDWKEPKTTAGLAGDSPLKTAISEAKDPLRVLLNSWRGEYRHKTFRYHPSSNNNNG